MKKFNEKLREKIALAQHEAETAKEVALDKLLDNKTFIEAQRSVSAKEKELTSLNEIVSQLNSMSPFVAKDGRKFGINVFPVGTFGLGLSQVMGILVGSRSAFIDEKMMEYSAITGISMLELVEAQEAIGSPAYFKDGRVQEEVRGDYVKLKALLQGIFIKLGLNEFSAEQITKDKFDLYFAVAETKAHKQLAESEDLKTLEDNSKDFVLTE